MTQMELIDRLCAVNSLMCDIVREQAAIIAQHGIEELKTEEETEAELQTLFGKTKRMEEENDIIESQLRRL